MKENDCQGISDAAFFGLNHWVQKIKERGNGERERRRLGERRKVEGRLASKLTYTFVTCIILKLPYEVD